VPVVSGLAATTPWPKRRYGQVLRHGLAERRWRWPHARLGGGPRRERMNEEARRLKLPAGREKDFRNEAGISGGSVHIGGERCRPEFEEMALLEFLVGDASNRRSESAHRSFSNPTHPATGRRLMAGQEEGARVRRAGRRLLRRQPRAGEHEPIRPAFTRQAVRQLRR